ncbi:MAG: ShlB/FhaC/HecB family hemolysin secretion/activation protein [Leptolyngbya sp. SIOISBB]|nr:ShlB/FhaC/HecB family hemolysin secretion/activation protein [Leptolyngbya sp. SIOISBB]
MTDTLQRQWLPSDRPIQRLPLRLPLSAIAAWLTGEVLFSGFALAAPTKSPLVKLSAVSVPVEELAASPTVNTHANNFPPAAVQTASETIALTAISPDSSAEPSAVFRLPEAEIAQIEPNPRPTLPPPEELLDEMPTEPDLTVPDAPEPTVPDGELPETVTITVERFIVEGSTVFSEAELQAVLTPYTGRPLTLNKLLEARSAITQLYVDGGYASSGAFIPPQEPEAGTVLIQVIEGSLVAIEVNGTHRLNPDYVSSRLGVAATPPLQVDRLVDALRLLQLDPLIENIAGELSAGLEPGTNRLSVQVDEADSFDMDFVSSNDRSIAVGTWERGVFANEHNLSGLGDALQIGYLDTDGSARLIADYRIPVSPYNTTVGAHFEYTSSRVISEPADILDIQTDSFLVDLNVRHPVIRTPTEELGLSLSLSWNRSDSEFLERILGESLPFPSFGANEDGEIETYALRFAQDWVKRGRSDVVAARSQFSLGLGGTDPADPSGEAPDGNFFSWLGQAQWARLLSQDILLLVRGEAQFATDTLPTSELYSLGGQSTVRGYRQDRLLTDNALFATAEIRLPLLRDRERNAMLQIIPFFDVGTGWNTNLDDPETSTLVGTGLGLLWTESDVWTARLDWGIPLTGDDESGNSWQAQGIYFSVGLNLF